MSVWSSKKPTESGWYLFHGHPDAEVKGILGDATTEFVGVASLTDIGALLFSGPGMFGHKAAIGMWLRVDLQPPPKQTWPWKNLEVIQLRADEPARVQKPSVEKWYIIGEEGENILGISVPAQIAVPLWKPKSHLTNYITALVDAHTEAEGCPPARIVQFIRPSDNSIGLAAGGRVQTEPISA